MSETLVLLKLLKSLAAWNFHVEADMHLYALRKYDFAIKNELHR
jgi:hypothetical protein